MPERPCLYLADQRAKAPAGCFYDFKGKKLTGEVLDELYYQFMRRLEKEGLITLKELYIDETKIEANANRYTFVWRGSLNYHLANLLDSIDAQCHDDRTAARLLFQAIKRLFPWH